MYLPINSSFSITPIYSKQHQLRYDPNRVTTKPFTSTSIDQRLQNLELDMQYLASLIKQNLPG